MKRTILLLLMLSAPAQAKMQYLTCQSPDSQIYKKIEGNVDREAGKSGTLLITSYTKGKAKSADIIKGRDIKFVKKAEGEQLFSEWMSDLTLTLPTGSSDTGELDLDSQNGLVHFGPVQCAFKDEDTERLEGRELCFQHQKFCSETFKRFPKADEKKEFLAKAMKYETANPDVAVRRILSCVGTMQMNKTSFKILGSLSEDAFLIGNFVVRTQSSDGHKAAYRVYKRKDLILDWNEQFKGLQIRTDRNEKFILNYRSDKAEAIIRGEDTGMVETFAGPLTCTLSKISRAEMASHDHCLSNYLGCELLDTIRPDQIGPDDLADLRALHQLAVSIKRRDPKP